MEKACVNLKKERANLAEGINVTRGEKKQETVYKCAYFYAKREEATMTHLIGGGEDADGKNDERREDGGAQEGEREKRKRS
jgi:hypothetical protein